MFLFLSIFYLYTLVLETHLLRFFYLISSEFVSACKKVTGKTISVYEQSEARPGDYAEVYADVSKIQKDLNWTARYTDLEESMGHAWAWRRKHATEY